MLKARHDAVHGGLDAALGLRQVLAADPRLLKGRVILQQLQGGGQVVVQERAGGILLGRRVLDGLEDTARHLLDPVDLGAQRLVGDTVVQLPDLPQRTGVALGRLRRHRRFRRLPELPGLVEIRGGGRLRPEQHTAAHVHIGLVAPQSLLQHEVHVLLHAAAGHVRGAGQIVQRHSGLLPRRAEVGGEPALAALHGAAAQQQRYAAGQQPQRIEKLPQEVHPLVVADGKGQVLPHGREQGNTAHDAQNGADDLHGLGALVGVIRGTGDLLHGAAGLFRLGRGRRRSLGGALPAPRRCPAGIFPFVAALTELDEQQDQADRPRHGKHDGDKDPRAEVVVFFRRLRRPEAVVIVVFVCHQDLNPFPCSFRLLPFSSTI